MKPHTATELYLEDRARQVPGFGFTIVREGLSSESYDLYTAFFDPLVRSRSPMMDQALGLPE